MNRILHVGDLSVEVTEKSRVKNLYIRVAPSDGFVTVTAPNGTDDEMIRLFLLRRMSDITKARKRFIAQERQSQREYVSGEAYYLWGLPYMLQIRTAKSASNQRYVINKIGEQLILTIPSIASDANFTFNFDTPGHDCDSEVTSNSDARKEAITEWYRQELRRVLGRAAPKCEKIVGVKANGFRIKNMKTKWVSCNIQDRRVWVNLQLVKKPPECLDYVLIHELLHLIEPHHTPKFWALVEKFCPGWREAKNFLSTLPLDYMKGNSTENLYSPEKHHFPVL